MRTNAESGGAGEEPHLVLRCFDSVTGDLWSWCSRTGDLRRNHGPPERLSFHVCAMPSLWAEEGSRNPSVPVTCDDRPHGLVATLPSRRSTLGPIENVMSARDGVISLRKCGFQMLLEKRDGKYAVTAYEESCESERDHAPRRAGLVPNFEAEAWARTEAFPLMSCAASPGSSCEPNFYVRTARGPIYSLSQVAWLMSGELRTLVACRVGRTFPANTLWNMIPQPGHGCLAVVFGVHRDYEVHLCDVRDPHFRKRRVDRIGLPGILTEYSVVGPLRDRAFMVEMDGAYSEYQKSFSHRVRHVLCGGKLVASVQGTTAIAHPFLPFVLDGDYWIRLPSRARRAKLAGAV